MALVLLVIAAGVGSVLFIVSSLPSLHLLWQVLLSTAIRRVVTIASQAYIGSCYRRSAVCWCGYVSLNLDQQNASQNQPVGTADNVNRHLLSAAQAHAC